MSQISIRTEDGTCPAWTYGDPARPGVLVFMDGIGMRPAIREIGQRLGDEGFHALVPDLFYRMGDYTPIDPADVDDPAKRQAWFAKVGAIAQWPLVMKDCKAYLAHFKEGPVGTTGYCMGGRLSIMAAASYPDRVVAACAFHPGMMVIDAPHSPHLHIGTIKGEVYVAGASDDASYPAEQQKAFDEALTKAGVKHVCETYPAKHGWVPSDTPVHDKAQSERHWAAMLGLFRRQLR